MTLTPDDIGDSNSEERELTPAEKAASINSRSFQLVEPAYVHDSLSEHREVWSAGLAAGMADKDSPDHAAFQTVLKKSIQGGHTRLLPAGTELELTGRATGMATEVHIPGCPGKWHISTAMVKKAGLEPPPVDFAYRQEQFA